MQQYFVPVEWAVSLFSAYECRLKVDEKRNTLIPIKTARKLGRKGSIWVILMLSSDIPVPAMLAGRGFRADCVARR